MVKEQLCHPCAKSPRRAITYTWFVSLVLVFAAFLCGCVVASQINDEDVSHALGFAAVWMGLTCIAMGIGGTVIMRRFQTEYFLGVLIGMIFMLAMICLVVGAVFAGQAELNLSDRGGDVALSIFSIFLFVVYLVFAGLLLTFSEEIIHVEPQAGDKMDKVEGNLSNGTVDTAGASMEAV